MSRKPPFDKPPDVGIQRIGRILMLRVSFPEWWRPRRQNY
jgi:hypothetical protein